MSFFNNLLIGKRGAAISRLLLLAIPLIYLATLAQTPVVGDPTEYTFVAHVLGVAHPPGYALMTLLTKMYQLLIPAGTIAWRSHLVGLTAGTVAALCVYGTVAAIGGAANSGASGKAHASALPSGSSSRWPAIIAAFIVALSANHWQHSIHANPHIITATFLAFNLYALTKWYSSFILHPSSFFSRWLYAFCLSAGLGVTHHPLTVFALPACALFVLIVHPRILLDVRTLLKGTAFVLFGLLPWLYFPIRAAALTDTQFVSNMNTLDGFLDLVLARGLRVNLFAFGLSDQWDRLTVFWTLLRLQYALPVIFLAVVGVGWLALRKKTVNWQQIAVGGQREESNLKIDEASPSSTRQLFNASRLLILYLGAFALNYLFVMNTVQDVMAYLIGPFLMVGLLAGVGLVGLIDGLKHSRISVGGREIGLLLALMAIVGPGFQLLRNAPTISLRGYTEGIDYVTAVREQFDGRGEGAVLLNDWEHMTPIWYELLVEKRGFDAEDVRPIFVSAAKPWIDHVFENLPAGARLPQPLRTRHLRRRFPPAGSRHKPRPRCRPLAGRRTGRPIHPTRAMAYQFRQSGRADCRL